MIQRTLINIVNDFLKTNMTNAENHELDILTSFIETSWTSFLRSKFSGLDPILYNNMTRLDSMIQIFSLKNPDAFLSGSSIASDMPKNASLTLLQYLTEPTLQDDVDEVS